MKDLVNKRKILYEMNLKFNNALKRTLFTLQVKKANSLSKT